MPKAQHSAASVAAAETPSRQSQLLALIQREQGATIVEIVAATGWLPHTARAAISGLRKRGHDIQGERKDGVSRYRIVAGKAA